MLEVNFNDVSEMNKAVVGKYFANRGFMIKKLDDGHEINPTSACDWLVWSGDRSFLCEVKTINSTQRGGKGHKQIFDNWKIRSGNISKPRDFAACLFIYISIVIC
jgi:hypothetical protein